MNWAILATALLLAVASRSSGKDDELDRQREEQAFVAEVGRKPLPKGIHNGKSHLHFAAELDLPVLTRSLIRQGADVNAKDEYGLTPLHFAAAKDAAAVVLLEHGADVNAKSNKGATTLHGAALKDSSTVAGLASPKSQTH